MAKILGIFGSTGGNAELVMDKVAEVLKSKGHEMKIIRAEEAYAEDIKDHDLYIFASPTYGHGVLQHHFQEFADKLEKADFSDKNFAVIGLGDQRYEKEYLLESAKILETLVKERGGKLIQTPLRILNAPIQHIDSSIKSWAEQLSEKLVV